MMKLDALVPALNMGTPKVIRNNAGGMINHLIYFKVMLLSFIGLLITTLSSFMGENKRSPSQGHPDDGLSVLHGCNAPA